LEQGPQRLERFPIIDERDRLLRRAAETPGVISFAGGLPDPALFPKRQLGEAFVAALQTDAAGALQYGWPEGAPELREWIAGHLSERGAAVEAEQVIVTSGAQQAIQIAMAVVGAQSRVGVEPESYPGALDIFRQAKARLVPLEEAADLYYVMPGVSNPRGRSMPATERRALLEGASRSRGFIVEDDAYQGTNFSGLLQRPLLADDPGRVFHVGTFSKTLCPGLRLGWLVPPRALAKRALKRKQASDLQANSLTQALLLEYLKSGHFERLQRRARRHYRRKLERLLAAVERELPELECGAPIGGFSLWVEGKRRLDDTKLLKAAIEEGVCFDLGAQFRHVPSRKLGLRLCFSAVPEADIGPGIRRLARALQRFEH
jgi:2-aminoadipate transaminase